MISNYVPAPIGDNDKLPTFVLTLIDFNDDDDNDDFTIIKNIIYINRKN